MCVCVPITNPWNIQAWDKLFCPHGTYMKPKKDPSSAHVRRNLWDPHGENPVMPMWDLYEAQQVPIISPSGLTNEGPPWKLRTNLAGPQLGSQAGPHISALVEPIWAPHECAGWDLCQCQHLSLSSLPVRAYWGPTEVGVLLGKPGIVPIFIVFINISSQLASGCLIWSITHVLTAFSALQKSLALTLF